MLLLFSCKDLAVNNSEDIPKSHYFGVSFEVYSFRNTMDNSGGGGSPSTKTTAETKDTSSSKTTIERSFAERIATQTRSTTSRLDRKITGSITNGYAGLMIDLVQRS